MGWVSYEVKGGRDGKKLFEKYHKESASNEDDNHFNRVINF